MVMIIVTIMMMRMIKTEIIKFRGDWENALVYNRKTIQLGQAKS